MTRRAKASVQEKWRREWKAEEKTGHFAVSNRFPPSLKPNKQFKELNRELFGRLVQTRTGHGAFGEYYRRFHIEETQSCPCGETLQTREHIITECNRYDDERKILEKVSEGVTLRDVLGTKEGVEALAKFLDKSGAFTKTGRPRKKTATPIFTTEGDGEGEEEGGGDGHARPGHIT